MADFSPAPITETADPLTNWAERAARMPADSASLLEPIRALISANRTAEAEVLLDASQFRFPQFAAFAIESARIAQRRGDTAEALRRWTFARNRFPDDPTAWCGIAAAHRDAGNFDAADRLLDHAQERFPDVPWLIYDKGWVAHIRRDWVEAARRWEVVRARVPDALVGYSQGAVALRELGRLDEAHALLECAAGRFPDDPHLTIEQGWLAQVRGDWATAAQHWQAVRDALPQEEAGYTAGARALRELGRTEDAGKLLQAAIACFPGRRSPYTEYAWLAHVRRDWPAAIERWAAVRAAFPDHAEAYVQGARALAELWQHEEAERLLAEGQARLPDAAVIAVEHAWLAYRQSRWPESTERFTGLRDRFPVQPDGWLGGALTLRNQSLFRDADALLAQGMARLPDNRDIALEHAMLPVFPIYAAEKDRPESLRRMAALRDRFPAFEPCWLQGIQLLNDAGQPDAAEALARTGSERLPDSIVLAVTYADAAVARADWSAAAERYRAVTARFPNAPEGPVGAARALSRSGQHDDAEAMLWQVIERFPDTAAPLSEYAEVAVRRHDWPEAARRWSAAEARFPQEKTYAHRLYEARLRMTESDPNADPTVAAVMYAQVAPAPKPDVAAVDRRVHDLVMQFENLGGRGLGCEFGIFQRDCGAEPLGLLRWADMPYEGLVFALDSRFEGVGAPENTELFLTAVSGGRGEYCTRDRRGMMFMRAFVYEDEVPFDKMYTSSCRRLQFLARKLIDDLEQGSKIFVFRLTDRNLTDAELDCLHAAMRAYGDNTLLYVRYDDAAHPNGTVELAKPGLLIGYIDRFKMSPTGELSAAPPTASWLRICQNAWEVWASLKA